MTTYGPATGHLDPLVRGLIKIGKLPPECVKVTWESATDGLVQLTYTVFLTTADVAALTRAMAEAATESEATS